MAGLEHALVRRSPARAPREPRERPAGDESERRAVSRAPVPLGVLLAGAILAAGAPDAPAQQPAALVTVDAVRTEPLTQTVPVSGRLVPRRAGAVAARVAGPVSEVRIEVGDRVAAGDVLAVLDSDLIEVERDLAAAHLAEARAKLETRRARVELARLERARLERLKKTQSAAKASFEDARQQEIIALAEVQEAAAVVKSAQATLRQAEIRLARSRVVAPYAGVVTQRLIEAGGYVQAGQATVRMLADATLEIEAEVPFDRIGGLDAGTPVTFTLDDASVHRAVVRVVVPEENRLTRTRAVRFVPRFNGARLSLAAEQSVTVAVPVGAPRSVVSVHKDAIIRRGPQSLVYVVEDDTAQIRPVALGAAVGNRFEVLDGLREGERVVVRGNERLRPNEKVRTAESTS